jgi:glucosylglycerate synthase
MADVDTQEQQLEALGRADIVLGVFSHDSAETIAHIVRAGQEALSTYFPESRGVLVNVDGGSKDGAPALALEAAVDKSTFLQITYPAPRLSVEQYGMPAKANAYQTLFGVAGKVDARVCAVVDGNISSFQGSWVEALVRPVFEEQFDLVSPCYLRHKYDGPILHGIVYPLTRALYGKRIRQPIGGDFAFSAKLIENLVRQPQLDSNTGGFGIDAWISTRAACGNFRLAQAFLGPRTLTQHELAPEVSMVLAEVLGAIFTEMGETASIWQRIRHSEVVPTFGSGCEPIAEDDASTAPIDIHPMIESFRLGFQNLQDIWRIVLSPATLVELKRMGIRSAETFRFEDVLWARVIYDFALAYQMRIMDRNHLLHALTPMYLGWVAAYALSVRDLGPKEIQDRIETLCLAYEMQKGYFISRWRWPDRFNP